jgi:hypothetical protein
MSRLFRRPSSKAVSNPQDDTESVFSSLLTPPTTMQPVTHQAEQPPHRRTKSSPGVLNSPDQISSRPWLSLLVAEGQSWTADRPAKRKLVKDPNSAGSARPSFSVELLDHGGDEDRRREEGKERLGLVRRGVERIRELYRREKG